MPGLAITNGTDKRFQIHYYTNGHPQRLAFLEIEPGQTQTLGGRDEELKELVEQNAIYGMKEERDASVARQTPAITYAISDEEPEGVDFIRRKLYDEEADIHVLAGGGKGEPVSSLRDRGGDTASRPAGGER